VGQNFRPLTILLKTSRNGQILQKKGSIDGFDSIDALFSLNKHYHCLGLSEHSDRMREKLFILFFWPSDELCLQWRIKSKCKRFQLLEGDKNDDCSVTVVVYNDFCLGEIKPSTFYLLEAPLRL